MKALAFLLLICCAFSPASSDARPQNLQQLSDIMKEVLPIPMPGPITSLYRPNCDTVREAELKFTAQEPMFVAMLPDGPHIYPQQYLLWHQVINELVDDHAYAITYCPVTGTLIAYDAQLQGINLIFDVEGHTTQEGFYGFLYDGNSVLMDRNTGSLWLQETGMAFDGALFGRGLSTVPVFWTTWEYAKRVFPQAPVLSRPRGRRPYGRDPYGSYLRKGTYYDNDIFVYTPKRISKLFKSKTPMLCMEYETLLMSIDIGYVKKKGAVNFFIGPNPFLAVHDKKLDVVRIYNRQIWADPFLFIIENGKLVDISTRSVWDPATGVAIDGNMKGSSMKEYFGTYSMWFAWYSINPETLTIPGPGEVPAHLLNTDAPGGNGELLPPEQGDGLPGRSKW